MEQLYQQIKLTFPELEWSYSDDQITHNQLPFYIFYQDSGDLSTLDTTRNLRDQVLADRFDDYQHCFVGYRVVFPCKIYLCKNHCQIIELIEPTVRDYLKTEQTAQKIRAVLKPEAEILILYQPIESKFQIKLAVEKLCFNLDLTNEEEN